MEAARHIPTRAEVRRMLRDRVTQHYAPGRAVILGKRLKPFTLWHWRTLDLLHSPFAPDAPADEEPWTTQELLIATRICTLAPNADRKIAPGKWSWLRWWWALRSNRGALSEHGRLLELYIHASCARPLLMNHEGRSIQVPPWLYYAARLMELGMEERTAWTMQPGAAAALILAHDEAHGNTEWVGVNQVIDALRAGYTLEEAGLA